MMDLHWFLNNGNLRLGLRDLIRFGMYVLRGLLGGPLVNLPASRLLIVVDTPGVGGVETLLPLLSAKPTDVHVTIAVTEFIAKDTRLTDAIHASSGVRLANIDRIRVLPRGDTTLVRAAADLARRYPKLWWTLPLFIWRHHSYCAAAQQLMDATKASAMVVFNERMIASASFSESALRRGVCTYAVQHGNLVDNYLPIMVDNYLTWGRFHSDWIARRSSCRTTPIGSPRLDTLECNRLKPWGFPDECPVHLVFFSQVGTASVPPAWIAETRRMVLSLVEADCFRITIKLHPLDRRESWLSEGELALRVQYLEGHVDLATSLQTADVMCSFYSTVLAEGLLYDIPVVQLNPYPNSVPRFPDSQGIACVSDARQLRDLIADWKRQPAKLLALRKRQRELRDGYFSNLGTASTRFWEVVASSAQEGTPCQ